MMQETKSLPEFIEEQFPALSSRLPVFHPLALELQRLKADGQVEVTRIVAVIEKDPVLAAQILRLANSSLYRGLSKIETLNRAVVRLGITKVVSLAFAVSQSLAYRSNRQPFGEMLARLWQRTYIGACGARWLAERIGQAEQAEEAFLAALFHDLGELFLLRALEQLADQTGELTQAVIEEVGFVLHPKFGARLLTQWNLPEAYARIAADHHLDAFAEDDWLMACVRLVDLACRKHGIGMPAEPDIVLAATYEAEVLGLKEITLAEFEVFLEDETAALNHSAPQPIPV